MTRATKMWGAMVLAAAALVGCGGGNDGGSSLPAPPAPPPVSGALGAKLTAAAAVPANDTATNSSSAFMVLQDNGVPAVVVAGPPKVNFTVFSDGVIKSDVKLADVSFAIAKLVPGANGEIDQWVSYVNRTEVATPGVGPGGTPVLASAKQATTDPKPASQANQLVFNAEGYYTYTFSTNITDPAKTMGVTFEPNRTHRIAIQLSYVNAAGETVRVNPYFDVTFDANGRSVQVTNPSQTRVMADVSSCNGCHDRLALHGGGRVDVQYCVMCHNPGTTDANSGNVLTHADDDPQDPRGPAAGGRRPAVRDLGLPRHQARLLRSRLPAGPAQLHGLPHRRQSSYAPGRQLEIACEQGVLPDLPREQPRLDLAGIAYRDRVVAAPARGHAAGHSECAVRELSCAGRDVRPRPRPLEPERGKRSEVQGQHRQRPVRPGHAQGVGPLLRVGPDQRQREVQPRDARLHLPGAQRLHAAERDEQHAVRQPALLRRLPEHGRPADVRHRVQRLQQRRQRRQRAAVPRHERRIQHLHGRHHAARRTPPRRWPRVPPVSSASARSRNRSSRWPGRPTRGPRSRRPSTSASSCSTRSRTSRSAARSTRVARSSPTTSATSATARSAPRRARTRWPTPSTAARATRSRRARCATTRTATRRP